MRYLIITLSLIVSGFVNAQQAVDNQFNTWITLKGDHAINERFDLHTLFSMRRNDFLTNWQQSLVRIGGGYKLSNQTKMQAGYDWVVTFPYGKQPIAQKTNEHRIWFHWNSRFKEGRFYFQQRFRFENRAIEQVNALVNDPQFKWAFRIRYKLGFKVPLNRAKLTDNTAFFSAGDELFMNLDNPSKRFDQNWFYTGFGWKYNNKNSVQISYMNQFLPKSDHIHVENNHTLKLTYQHNFSLMKE